MGNEGLTKDGLPTREIVNGDLIEREDGDNGVKMTISKPLAGARRRLARAAKKAAPKRKKKQPKAARVARTVKARTAASAKRATSRVVSIELTMPHWVNGIAYGPGTVKVTADMARGFEENERRVRQNDAHTFGQGRAAFIGPGGRAIPVSMQMMDSPNLSQIEAFSF